MQFIFDAQMPLRLAKGLEILDQENENNRELKVKIFHADTLLGEGALDSEVIKRAAEIDATIISEDDDFYRIKGNKVLVKNLKVGYVYYKPPKHGSRYWEKSQALILAWEKLKSKIKKADKPFFFKINRDGEISEEPF